MSGAAVESRGWLRVGNGQGRVVLSGQACSFEGGAVKGEDPSGHHCLTQIKERQGRHSDIFQQQI